MATRVRVGTDVYDEAISRLVPLYKAGHRLVLSFSAGKDSGTCLELMLQAARITDRLPVEVILRDEEVMFPGTYEYAERVAARPDVHFTWFVAHQPIINVYNRAEPYWWVMDQRLPPEQWVRQPPPWYTELKDINIEAMTRDIRFPPAPGKELFAVYGVRVAESRGRMYGLFSSGGYLTKPNWAGTRGCRPIYDWTDADVWKAHLDGGWDYNRAYDTLLKMGVPRQRLRTAPPTMNPSGVESLQLAAKAWPQWFDRVAERLPGVRLGVMYGKQVVEAKRRLGESWEATFQRECIDNAPEWIRKRAERAREYITQYHHVHSTQPLPEVTPCHNCSGNLGSWKALTKAMYNGDPFSVKNYGKMAQVDPDYFRPGSGKWMGLTSF
jgi:predicted phosphoadenosine phosphosulfate sulfurtransferase